MEFLPKPSLCLTAVSAPCTQPRQRWQRENLFVRSVRPFLCRESYPERVLIGKIIIPKYIRLV